MKKRHGVLMLLTSLAMVTYLDRLCIASLGPRMMQDLDLSPKQWGWVMAAFTIAYGALEIPAGALGDRFGQRRILLRIVLWWSAFTALTGAVSGFFVGNIYISSFSVLLLVRFLFAAGEAGAFPNISGSVSRWFPATERGRVQGFVWGASRLGAILAPLMVQGILVVLDGNWRAVFWTFGSFGVVWAVVWHRYYCDRPADHPRITPEEIREIGASSGGHDHRGLPWSKLFRSRQLWLVMVMYSFYAWGSTFYLSWLHTYLVKGCGFREQQMLYLATLPFVLGAMANPLGGILADFMGRRFGLKTGYRLMGSICLITTAVLLLAASFTTGKWTGLILLILGFGSLDLMLPTAWATCVHLGGRYAGAVSGAMNSFGHIGGTVCAVAFGYLAYHYSYQAPLTLVAGMLLIAAGLFSRIDPSRPLLAEEREKEGQEELAAEAAAANPV